MEGKIKSIWEDERHVIEYVMRDPLLFGDFRNACNEDEPRFYEDLLDYEAVYTLFMEVSKNNLFYILQACGMLDIILP